MARKAGLRLPQDGGEVGDREFSLADEHQEAEPRRFGCSLKRAGQHRKSELNACHLSCTRLFRRHKDIFMSLNRQVAFGNPPTHPGQDGRSDASAEPRRWGLAARGRACEKGADE